MRMACSAQRFEGLVGVAAVLAAGFVLSGCSGGSLGGSDWFPSVPGFSRVVSSSADGSAMAAATPASISMEDNCPIVDIRAGAGTLAVTTKTQQATANDVRYQLTFTQLARQCALIGTTIKMRVGVQGRAIAGPAGAPNQVEVPLRYAVVREGVEPKTITTKFRRIPLALPPGNTNVPFTDIEEDLSFPMPSRDELEAYIVYVGFDEVGDRNERRPAAAKKGKAK
jgi:hypothetical protein